LPEETTTTIFHNYENHPTGLLEIDWLNSIFPKTISWSKMNYDMLTKSSEPILLYNNIPGKEEYVRKSFRDIIQAMEAANTSITLLHLSDEFGLDDLTIYNSKAVKQVIRTYWRTDLPLYGDKVYVIPLGFTNARYNTKEVLPTFRERQHTWSFAGSMDRPGRQAAISVLRTVEPYKEYAKANWGSPNLVESDEYKQVMENSKFVPCFKGFKSLESFRFYEALESGAIPIYVPSESSMAKDEYRELFGHHPFLGFPSWEKAAELLPKLVTQTEVMEKHRLAVREWWVSKKQQIRTKLHSMLTGLCNNA
jgi:hypothetical protein